MSTNIRTIGPNILGQSIHKANRGTKQTMQGWAVAFGWFQSVGSGAPPPAITNIQLVSRHGAVTGQPLGFTYGP